MSHQPDLIGALVDGELHGLRRWLVRRHLSRCPVCAIEYRHQVHVRQLLAAQPPPTPMSDSADFFWSKVKADIQRRRPDERPVELPALDRTGWLRQHQLAAAVATVLIVAGLAVLWSLAPPRIPAVARSAPRPAPPAQPAQAIAVSPQTSATVLAAQTNSQPTPPAGPEVDHMDSDIPTAKVTTFDSQDAGVTVIWVSGLPWTSDMKEMATVFANPNS